MFHILTLLFFFPFFFLPFFPFIWTSPSNLKVFTSNVKAVSVRARDQGFPLPTISRSPDYFYWRQREKKAKSLFNSLIPYLLIAPTSAGNLKS